MAVRITRSIFFGMVFSLLVSGAAFSAPSNIVLEGVTAVWKIGAVAVWRFPSLYAIEATTISDRFNALYSKGFDLDDIQVLKKGETWTLGVGDRMIATALPRYVANAGMSPHLMGLTWLSRVYEAVGSLHAQQLTPTYKLGGAYDLSTSVSWYGGKRMLGKKFANGEYFTESHLSAAAKNLPFGTLVKITTPATGKSVVVRITDRFKEHKNRVLDLSQAAAELLGIKGMGVAKVTVKVIGRVDKVGGR
jgi:rare lipoprotein A